MNTDEKIKEILVEDIDWMWEEGHYRIANRLDRILQYVNMLEKKNGKYVEPTD